MKRKSYAVAAGLTALTLLATGCLGGGSQQATSDSTEETAKDTISIMYAFSGVQSETFQQDMNAWGEANNVKIEFIQSNEFEVQISAQVNAGNAPDIAIFPQPGILQSMAAEGKLAALDTQVDLPALEADIVPGFLDAATVNNVVYGAPMSMNGKSFYWYSKPNFEAAGYQVPTTHEELLALIDQIKADGKTPLCYGMESGSATGWPATDWIEDYVLHSNGAEVYDGWVKGEVKFDSPEVRKAFDIYTEVLMTEGNVYGGIQNAPSNPFGTALNPMFGSDPQCFIGKQGNFITQSGFFPDDVVADIDNQVGMFVTPSVDGTNPVLGGGDLAAAFTKNDANVKKALAFMTTDPAFGDAQAKTGSWLSPLKSFDTSKYPNEVLREVVAAISEADVFRFDGSDAMPGAVGSAAFWTGMVDYTTGTTGLDATLQFIDAAWPTS